MYTSEADFHKPGMYAGRALAWANAWDVFRRTPSRGGRGRRAAVGFYRSVLFERSEFLIDTSEKKSLRVCTCARVHVCTCARARVFE